MLKDLSHDVPPVDEADDTHFAATFGSDKRVGFVDLADEVGPAFFNFFGYRWRGYLDDLPPPACLFSFGI